MSKRTIYLLGIILTIVIGTLLYWWFCCRTSDFAGSKKDSRNNKLESHFRLNGEGIDYQCDENFVFPLSGFTLQQPVSESVNSGIAQLRSVFENNPKLQLLITGFSSTAETNNSAFPNLGFARANVAKNYFSQLGIPSSRIQIGGELQDSVDTRGNTVFGPLDFSIVSLETDLDNLNALNLDSLKAELAKEALVLYFETNQTSISLDPAQKQTVLKMVNYLDHVPDGKILVVGHTDNTGEREINIEIGQKRADFAKEYFVRNGVSEILIETLSMGPDEPIADNETEEGRSENRRTVISIK